MLGHLIFNAEKEGTPGCSSSDLWAGEYCLSSHFSKMFLQPLLRGLLVKRRPDW